jgi:hypothetical protein
VQAEGDVRTEEVKIKEFGRWMTGWEELKKERATATATATATAKKEAAKQQRETHVAMGLEFVGGGCLDAE